MTLRTSLLAAAFAATLAPSIALADNVLTLGGSVTEIVYALGEGDQLIGRDTTSNYPPDALDLADVGYIRQLSAEGVLSVGPELIISVPGARPLETVEILREASVPFVEVTDGFTREAVTQKITDVAEALGVPEKGEALAAKVDAEFAAGLDIAKTAPSRKVMFILSTSGGKITASGRGTSTDAMISLAGGTNALTGFEGYKEVSAEAIMKAAPDVVLMMDRAGSHGASVDELFAMPALALTPAARAKALIKMDGMKLTGFGPRVGEAIGELASALKSVGPS